MSRASQTKPERDSVTAPWIGLAEKTCGLKEHKSGDKNVSKRTERRFPIKVHKKTFGKVTTKNNYLESGDKNNLLEYYVGCSSYCRINQDPQLDKEDLKSTNRQVGQLNGIIIVAVHGVEEIVVFHFCFGLGIALKGLFGR